MSHYVPVTEPIAYNVTEAVNQHFPWQNNLSILDGASCAARYFLTFHDTVEGWRTNGNPYEIDPLPFPYKDASGQQISLASGLTLNTTIPAQLDYIDYGPDVQTVGGLLAGGAAVLPLVAPADFVTGPVGIGITGLMAVAAFKAGSYDPQEPKWPLDVTTGLNDFQQDIADQIQINNETAVAYPPSSPNWVQYPKVNRFADTSKATWLAGLATDDQYAYWHGTGLGGKFVVSATDVVPQIIAPYAAYQFDAADLVIDTSGNPVYALANVRRTGTPVGIRQWTWVADPLLP